MKSHYNSQYYSGSYPVPNVGNVIAFGLAGAVVTGSVAAAKEIRKAKQGEEDRAQAVRAVAKEALGGGLAVAAGAIARSMFRSGFLGALAIVGVSVGVKYAYDGLTAEKPVVKAEVKTNPKKAAKK